ncbi:site-specific integrase [Quadrisphaera setariae]|uniref:site-specific integrase n=1 Tax=Quadrisphaera setariae TaxID=2593304 RepID=UPI00165032E7|nr:site-specific integrase [Quadrisphaera setariae]
MGRPALATGAAGLVSTHVETLDPLTGRWVRAASANGMGRSRWVARCRVPGADGEHRQVRATGATRREAEAALADNLARRARAEAAAAAAADDRVTTVADTAATWLAVLEATGARPGTRDLYRRSVVAHLVPRLGMLKVRHLSASVAERWLAEVADRSGPAAVRTARNCLRGVVDVALAKGVLDSDPLHGVQLPVTAAPAAAPVLTVAEAAHLLVVAAADADAVRHGLADLVAVLLGTGARLGEALALRWADVDVTPGAARVRVAARLDRASGRSTEVRRTADERLVPITDSLAALLRARRQRPSADVGEAALVFPTSRGTAADPAATTRRLRALFDAAGLPDVTSHALRATRAQRLLDAGAEPAEVARLLGTSRLRAGEVHTTGAVPAVAPAALIPRQRHTEAPAQAQDAEVDLTSSAGFADAGASSR